MAQIPCGFHGFRNVRNTGLRKIIKETGTANLWKGPTEKLPALPCYKRESDFISNLILKMILVQTFSDQDHDELVDQFKTLLTYLYSVEKRCQNVRLGDRIFYMQQDPVTTEGRMLLLENNEQTLADTQYNSRVVFNGPELPIKPIHLRKKTDLKNRTLIKQVRNLLACRPLLNMLRNMWNLRIVSNIFAELSDLFQVLILEIKLKRQ